MLKSLQEIESYFLFIAEQLYKVDYQHQKNIINIVKKFEKHKSRSQLVTDIENDIKDTGVALKSLLSIYLKNVYLKSFNDTHKEYSIKKLFALQELKKEDLKVTGGFLDEVTPYNLSFLEKFFASYETPFLKGWEDEQKKAIFGFLEELMMTGYSYDRAERGLRKLLGENPYGMDNKTYWEMVGRTEATRVFTQASLASAKSLGYTMKRVKTVVGCERCKEFEEQGAIPIDQPYANTLPNNPDIPFHPNCMCHYQYELEQGKYFSQYSYEPDKKLKPEVDLLAYNADLSKMSIEQLQRWADVNLKTFVDLDLDIQREIEKQKEKRSIFYFELMDYFKLNGSGIWEIIDKLVEREKFDRNELFTLWVTGKLKNESLDKIFENFINNMFLDSAQTLVGYVRDAEKMFGKLPTSRISLYIEEFNETMYYMYGFFNPNDSSTNIGALKEFMEYLMEKREAKREMRKELRWNSIFNYKGNFYHELTHALDNNSLYRFSQLIEKEWGYIEANILTARAFEQNEKVLELEKSIYYLMRYTSEYSQASAKETLAENYSTYYLYTQGYEPAVKQVEKWTKEQKEFYAKINEEYLPKVYNLKGERIHRDLKGNLIENS